MYIGISSADLVMRNTVIWGKVLIVPMEFGVVLVRRPQIREQMSGPEIS